MKRENMLQNILKAIYHYFLFFMLVAMCVSVTMSLFLSILTLDLKIVLTGDNLNRAAKLTFLCVLVLSLIITLIDFIRRRLTTQKITRRIADATKQVVNGNFETRIANSGRLITDDNFNEIIDSFNKMAAELGSLETLRSDFTANVSHEMKTPLSVIQNYATLLENPDLSQEKRLEYAKSITEASKKTAAMVSDILKLNKLENQQIFPLNTDYDLSEQLCGCLLDFENCWEEKSIELENDIKDSVHIKADQELLSLVWNNLFSNAFKFTPKGGKVSVSLSENEDYATVTVRDNGCGISASDGKRIFEKFYQGDTSHATSGNGLGLALVKRVIDILKGEISVESSVGEGSVFTVKIRKNYILEN